VFSRKLTKKKKVKQWVKQEQIFGGFKPERQCGRLKGEQETKRGTTSGKVENPTLLAKTRFVKPTTGRPQGQTLVKWPAT